MSVGRLSSVASLVLLLVSSLTCFADQENESQRNGDSIEKTERLGPVTAVARLSPAKPIIGDLVTLELEVTAESGVELLMPEFGEALDRFTITDFVPRESINDENQTVSTQKYRLRSPMSGERSVPPILIEFVDRRPGEKEAPDGLDAYELLLPRIDFTVQSVVPDSASGELKPPLGRLEKQTNASKYTVWAFVAMGLAVLAAVPLVVIWYLKKRKIARRRSAFEIARQRLDLLLSKPPPADEGVDDFFVELSSIVRQYLEDRFELRAPELTTEEFLDEVSGSPDLNNDHQSLLREFLRQADLVKFAGLHPDRESIRQSVAAAERFIDETREEGAELTNAHRAQHEVTHE